MASNPLDTFAIDPDDLKTIGKDLQRPECILAEKDGSLWSADARGGVVHIMPDGKQRVITQYEHSAFSQSANEADQFTKGTLRGTTIPYFSSPVPGLPMVHWNERIVK